MRKAVRTFLFFGLLLKSYCKEGPELVIDALPYFVLD